MKPIIRKLVPVLAIAIGVAGCNKYNVIETPGFDPERQPWVEAQMNPGWGGNSPTVCFVRSSEVPDRGDQCRVERGYEDGSGGWPDDDRNWVINYPNIGGQPGFYPDGPKDYFSWPSNPWQGHHPFYACPTDYQPDLRGCSIVLGPGPQDGWIFEGCVYNRAGNDYSCDFRSRFHKVMLAGGMDTINYLKATIDWGLYVKNAAVCSWNMFGRVVSNPMLVACNDGPPTGPIGLAAEAAPTVPRGQPYSATEGPAPRVDPQGDGPIVTSVPQERVVVNPDTWTVLPRSWEDGQFRIRNYSGATN